MVEVCKVIGLERLLLTAIKSSSELDGGVTAAAKVFSTSKNRTPLGRGRCGGGVALLLLCLAVGDTGIDLARVGGVRARVILNVTTALESSSLIHECIAINLKRACRITRVCYRRSSTTEVAGKSLEISTGGAAAGSRGSFTARGTGSRGCRSSSSGCC